MSTAIQRLQSLLPANRVAVDEATKAAHDADAQTAYRQRAIAVVTPRTSDEVVQTVRWCRDEGVPFVVRGSGTGLSAGATPVANGIVIVTTRLNRILHIDPIQRTALVEPGVVNLHLTAAAAPHGLFYAPDPSSQPVCTIGGNVGFNAGGAHCLKYGMTSNHVLGIKAVLATGEVVTWGAGTRETIGPDWTGLFVGNEGLFGIALEITLNLVPITNGVHTVLAGFSTTEAAGDAVSAIIAAGIVPVAIELMDELTIEAVRPVVPIAYPPDCRALLVIELDGPAPVVAVERPRLETVLRHTTTTGLVIAQNAAERAAIWRVRKSAYSAYGRLAPSNMVQDCVVPRRHLGEALRRIAHLAAAAGIRVANICHAGDGNIHPNLLHDIREPGAHEKVEHLAGQILEACLDLGGSITGEHGVGIEKRPYLCKMYGPAEIAFFHRIRRAYDPQELANPGKLLPDVDPQAVPSAIYPTSITELAATVRATPRMLAVGARTKPALSDVDRPLVSLRHLSGITAYEPAEFVLTALAGTPLREIVDTLAASGQCLAFDPPLVDAGATIGGTVAANLNGPGSFGRGRIRDAVLGVTFIDGTGEILTVGSRVVKNVAGFDVPKFLVGSCGRYGVLAEITLKVVPQPGATVTHAIPFADTDALLALLPQLANAPTLPDAVDIDVTHRRLLIRHSGPAAALEQLTQALLDLPAARRLDDTDATATWRRIREPAATFASKIVIPQSALQPLLAAVNSRAGNHQLHLHAAAGHGWLFSSEYDSGLFDELFSLGMLQQKIHGPATSPPSNDAEVAALENAVARVFDPQSRFSD